MSNENKILNSNTRWEEFTSLFAGGSVFDGILSAEIDYYRFRIDNQPFTEITDIVLDIIILAGELTIKVDNKEWKCSHTHNNFVSIKPMNNLQNISISKDFKGSTIALNKKFIIKNTFNPYPVPIERIMEMRFYPVFTFDSIAINNLLSIQMKVHRNFSRDVFCKRELVIVSVAEFEIEKIIIQLGAIELNTSNGGNKKTRQVRLCIKFCDLVFENCKNNHDVSFYADKLCITTQYLTRILRENYSRSAKEIIDHAIVSEAVVMLQSDLTLQQIAYKLNFADQSSFGKFFKKITGSTPSQFREESIEDGD